MKTLFISVATLVALVLSGFTVYNSINWDIKESYSVKFSSEDPSGTFQDLKGDIVFDENDLEGSSFKMTVDVASISTGNIIKDGHVKSSHWFDAGKYPEITFSSNKISKTATGYEVTGILEMRGIKKEITIPFTFADNVFNGSITVNRLDYNIGSAGRVSGYEGRHIGTGQKNIE